MTCDECKHYLAERDVHGHTLHQCGITKCPLVLRNEVLEEAAKVADAYLIGKAEKDLCVSDEIALKIREMKEVL